MPTPRPIEPDRSNFSAQPLSGQGTGFTNHDAFFDYNDARFCFALRVTVATGAVVLTAYKSLDAFVTPGTLPDLANAPSTDNITSIIWNAKAVRSGNVVYFAISINAFSSDTIWIASFDLSSETWTLVDKTFVNPFTGHPIITSVTIHSGTVQVTWFLESGISPTLVVTYNGGTFSAVNFSFISGGTAEGLLVGVADSNGVLHAVIHNANGMYYRSISGTTFNAPTLLTATNPTFGVMSASCRGLYLSGSDTIHLVVMATKPLSSGWPNELSDVIVASASTAPSASVKGIADRPSSLYEWFDPCVWDDLAHSSVFAAIREFTPSGVDDDMKYWTSTDDGVTWTGPATFWDYNTDPPSDMAASEEAAPICPHQFLLSGNNTTGTMIAFTSSVCGEQYYMETPPPAGTKMGIMTQRQASRVLGFPSPGGISA